MTYTTHTDKDEFSERWLEILEKKGPIGCLQSERRGSENGEDYCAIM